MFARCPKLILIVSHTFFDVDVAKLKSKLLRSIKMYKSNWPRLGKRATFSQLRPLFSLRCYTIAVSPPFTHRLLIASFLKLGCLLRSQPTQLSRIALRVYIMRTCTLSSTISLIVGTRQCCPFVYFHSNRHSQILHHQSPAKLISWCHLSRRLLHLETKYSPAVLISVDLRIPNAWQVLN